MQPGTQSTGKTQTLRARTRGFTWARWTSFERHSAVSVLSDETDELREDADLGWRVCRATGVQRPDRFQLFLTNVVNARRRRNQHSLVVPTAANAGRKTLTR
jgi:hypothetical protein